MTSFTRYLAMSIDPTPPSPSPPPRFVTPSGSRLSMRIGLACGPATGGVVGASMLRYHLFGPVTQEARGLFARPHGLPCLIFPHHPPP